MPRSTVSAWLKRLGLAKLDALEPKPEIVRYEYEHPGDLLHLDTKKLARIQRPGHRIHGDRSKRAYGVGWENAHVAIDDHSRVAYVEVLPAEDQHTCTAFLQRAVEHFASMGVAVRRVMTDNGPGYVSKRFNRLCHQLEIRHIYTRPYTPRTTAKPNASSAHSRSSGPTAPATRPQLDVLELYGPGSTTTSVTVPTPASA